MVTEGKLNASNSKQYCSEQKVCAYLTVGQEGKIQPIASNSWQIVGGGKADRTSLEHFLAH